MTDALPGSQPYLEREFDRLLDAARASYRPDGFAWLRTDGTPDPDRPAELWIATRMTHVLALGALAGRPGCAELVDHGVRTLSTVFHDTEYDGWFAAVEDGRPVATEKKAYDHAFVLLAGASALVAGRPGARELLDHGIAVVERYFWDEDAGLMRDLWNRDWTEEEPYRGANANMHSVEACLAVADALDAPVWRERALRIAQFLVHDQAAGNGWLMPEHYDTDWRARPDYGTDNRADRFRPYGATPGHLLEWSRLLLHLRGGLDDPPAWLLDDARALFDKAVAVGWAVDGAPGFVYTVDWDGTPVVDGRLHWVLAEGIGAAAVLHEVTGDPTYAVWYRDWWAYAEEFLVDREGGVWWHELDTRNRRTSAVWDGKPDTYHALQATVIPRLPAAPTMAAAMAAGLLDSVTPPLVG